MTTISSLMSTACAFGVSIGVLLPVESVLIPSSSGLGYLRVATHLEATALAPLFEHSVPAPSSSRSARPRQPGDKLLPQSISYVARVSAVLLVMCAARAATSAGPTT